MAGNSKNSTPSNIKLKNEKTSGKGKVKTPPTPKKNASPKSTKTTKKKKIATPEPVVLKAVRKEENPSLSNQQDAATTWNDTLQSIFNAAIGEMKQVQGTLYALSCEGAENFNDTADTLTSGVYESLATGKDNMETFFTLCRAESETAQILQDVTNTYSSKLTEQTMELCQKLMECRTIDDFTSLQGDALQSYTALNANALNQLAEAYLTFSDEALTPVNEHVNELYEKFNAALSEAA